MILERIHQVLGNIVRNYNIKDNYVDEYDPWLVTLAAEAPTIISTANRVRGYNPGQLVFSRDMIPHIKR